MFRTEREKLSLIIQRDKASRAMSEHISYSVRLSEHASDTGKYTAPQRLRPELVYYE